MEAMSRWRSLPVSRFCDSGVTRSPTRAELIFWMSRGRLRVDGVTQRWVREHKERGSPCSVSMPTLVHTATHRNAARITGEHSTV